MSSILRLLGDKYLIQYETLTTPAVSCSFDFVIDNQDKNTYLYNLCYNTYDEYGIRTGGNIFYLDKDQPQNYLDYKGVSRQTIGYNIEFDIIRIWFRRGINPLTDIDAISISFLLPLHNVSQTLNVGYFVINRDNFTSLVNISNEISYGDILFDKFVEFYVPRLSFLETDFINSGTSSFAWLVSYSFDAQSNIGLDFNSAPQLSLYELYNEQSVIDGSTGSEYVYWDIYNSYTTTLSIPELYSDLALYLNINTNYGIIEYRMYNTSVPLSVFINHLKDKNPTSDFVIKHNIKVFGVQGTNFYPLDQIETYQTDDWDRTNRYKPIIDNPSLYSSIIVNYTATLIDSATGSSFALFSSIVHNNPSDFELSSVVLSLSAIPNRVYNKIVNQRLDIDKLFYEQEFYISETKDGSALLQYNNKDDVNTQYNVVVIDTKDVFISINDKSELVNSMNVNFVIKPTTRNILFRIWKKTEQGNKPFDILSLDNISIKFYTSDNIIGQSGDIEFVDSNGLLIKLQDDLVLKVISSLKDTKVFYDVVYSTNNIQGILASGRVIAIFDIPDDIPPDFTPKVPNGIDTPRIPNISGPSSGSNPNLPTIPGLINNTRDNINNLE